MYNNNSFNPESIFNNDDSIGISIFTDIEMIEELEKEFNVNCMALKNEMFGFGVWFTENGMYGVYGDTSEKKELISLYWDDNEEQIIQAFDDAETLEEAIEAANAVIIGVICGIVNYLAESNEE